MATKPERMVIYLQEFLPITPHSPLFTCSYKISQQTKAILSPYHSVYDQETWQDGGLP